jgi:hypothetical protein
MIRLLAHPLYLLLLLQDKGTLIWPLHSLRQTIQPFIPEIGYILFLLRQKIYMSWTTMDQKR